LSTFGISSPFILKVNVGLFDSLMSAGLHGDNGLDHVTSISIMKTYILPILTYRLEVLQPRRNSNIHKLEQFQKSLLKRILSLPKNAPDPVLYIISGILPMVVVLLIYRSRLVRYKFSL
jgi:hypothetical protein